ncbi:right-handed parallel beta-helix repeat-containing protein [Streptomyces sp. NPDC007164]|uniref:galactose-binding domain-containing protein n=1 Tax=Streptomyces sp. NPDC007164 TaxID=3156918 RepID=UPI0033C2153A
MPLPLRPPLACLALTAALLTAATSLAPAAEAAPAAGKGTGPTVFHVAPVATSHACNHNNPCSPERAQRKVRDAVAGGINRDIVIELAGGTYRLDRPLGFGPQDSAPVGHTITWRAAPGADVTFSGARTVNGWKVSDAENGIWSAPADFDTRQLYVDGKRAILARSDYKHPTSGCSTSTCAWTADGLKGAGVASYAKLGDVSQLELVRHVRWKDYHCPVAGIEGDLIRMAQPCWKNAARTPRIHPDWNGATWEAYGGGVTYAVNAYGLLDEPGEFHLDRTAHRIYYKPRAGENLKKSKVTAPAIESLLTITGTPDQRVRGLSFEGIAFTDATFLRPGTGEGYAATQAGMTLTGETGEAPDNAGRFGTLPQAAVQVTAAEDITFRNNEFTRLGGAGLLVQQSRRTSLTGNHIHDTSGGGIYLGPTWHAPPEAEQSRDNTVAYNTVDHTGLDYTDTVGIWAGNEINTVFDHNTIDHTPYSGMSVGWGWTSTGRQNVATNIRISNNRITEVLRAETQMFDGGAVYTTNNLNGSVIEGNYVNRSDNGNAYYLDAGTDNVTVRNNVATRLGFKWVSANLDSLHDSLTGYGNWADTTFCSFDGNNDCTVGKDSRLYDNQTGLRTLPAEAVAVARASGATPGRDIELIAPNAALDKPATQSSTSGTQTANLANDGNLGNYAATGTSANPWWQVDLEKSQPVSRVSVWAQGNTSQEKLTDFYVLVSDEPFVDGTLAQVLAQPGVHAVRIQDQAARATEVPVNTSGRYVRIQLAHAGSINPSEVQVWN